MRPERRKHLTIASGIVVLPVFAVIVAVLRFNINSYKAKIETAASETMGLDVTINGKMRLSFFPFGLSAKDIHVVNKEGEILSLERLKVRAELMPLVNKQLRVTGWELVKPAVMIVKDAKGRYNFENTQEKSKKGQPGTAFSFSDLKVSNGSLVYLDKKTGEKTELKEIYLAIGDLSIAGAPGLVIKNLSFAGTMECKELRRKDLKIDNIKSKIKGAQGTIYFNPLVMDIFGSKGEGDITANESEAEAAYRINLAVSKLDFEKVQESFGAKKLISGKGALVTSLTVKEKKGRSLLSGINGTLSLRGNNLITHTVDLDKILSAYEGSQRFNLADVGAFFIAGPSVPLRSRGTVMGICIIRPGEGGAPLPDSSPTGRSKTVRPKPRTAPNKASAVPSALPM